MTHTEAARVLARAAREARADLMTRLEGPAQQLFATLHPPGLALLEAVLASPARARRMEHAWLQEHLLRAFVEILAPGPLSALNGDLRRVQLSDDQGRVSFALQMSVRSDSRGWTYRFLFDPLLFETDRDRLVISLKIPMEERGDRAALARWRLSVSAHLQSTDHLPLLYKMARQRQFRLARWTLLAGDRQQARELLDDIFACAPDLTKARALREALDDASAPQHKEMLDLDLEQLNRQKQQGHLRALGHDPLQDLGLRAAMLARLGRLAGSGLVDAKDIVRAQKSLRRAARHISRGDLGWGLPAAIVAVDRTLARMLASALDGERKPARALPPQLVLKGLSPPKEREVEQQLARRLLLANYDLSPRWIKGPEAPDKESRTHLLELRPEITAKHAERVIVARTDQRLGWGWLHPGLPAGLDVTVTFVDQGHLYWQERAMRARSLAELESVARQLLRREIFGPEEDSAALAMVGLVQLKDSWAIKPLLQLAASGPVLRRALAVRALAYQRDKEATAAILRAAGSRQAPVRAGAMVALGRRTIPAERDLLRKGLDDPDVSVAAAALQGLLRAGDPLGLRRARAWLLGDRVDRRERVLALAKQPGLSLSPLGKELLHLVRVPDAHSELLVAALVRALDSRCARALMIIFNNSPELQEKILQLAKGRSFARMYYKAMHSKKIAVRRLALLRLARLKPPPRTLMERALKQEDRAMQLAAQLGLAGLGDAAALLALGQGARGSCEERGIVLDRLCRFMDRASRGKLLLDALQSQCSQTLLTQVWELVLRYQPEDMRLLRGALGHRLRHVRVWGALTALGLRESAVFGKGP